MPDIDRRWKQLRILAYLWLLGCLIAVVVFVAAAALQWIQSGGSFFDYLDFRNVLNAVFFAWGGNVVRWEASRARERTERRAQFLSGDESAIPLAALSASENADQPVPPLPFELVGPDVAGTSIGTFVIVCVLAIAFVLAPVLFVLLDLIFWSPIDQVFPESGPFVISVTISLIVLVEVLLVLRLRRLVRVPLNTRIIATEDGLVKPRGRRAPQELRWRDARLFEVIAPPSSSNNRFTRAFALEGPESVITWFERATTDGAQLRQFLAVVAERCGLALRTLSPTLAETKAMVAGTLFPEPTPNFVYVVLSLMGSALLGVGVLALVFPIIGSVPVDAAIAFSFAAPALTLMPYIITLRRREAQSATRLPFALPPAPALASQTALRISGWVNPWRRLVAGALLLLFMLDIAAVVVASVRASLPDTALRQSAIWPPPALIVVFLIAMVGLAANFSTVISRVSRISADGSGLTSRRGRRETQIAWSEIIRIGITLASDGDAAFTVTSETGATIMWGVGSER